MAQPENTASYKALEGKKHYGSTCMDLKLLAEVLKLMVKMLALAFLCLKDAGGGGVIFFIVGLFVMAILSLIVFVVSIPLLALKQVFDFFSDLFAGNFLRAAAGAVVTGVVFGLAIALKEIILAALVSVVASGGTAAIPLLFIAAVCFIFVVVSAFVKWAVDTYQANHMNDKQKDLLQTLFRDAPAPNNPSFFAANKSEMTPYFLNQRLVNKALREGSDNTVSDSSFEVPAPSPGS